MGGWVGGWSVEGHPPLLASWIEGVGKEVSGAGRAKGEEGRVDGLVGGKRRRRRMRRIGRSRSLFQFHLLLLLLGLFAFSFFSFGQDHLSTHPPTLLLLLLHLLVVVLLAPARLRIQRGGDWVGGWVGG